MTFAEYARHRGVSGKSVTIAVQRERITTIEVDGKRRIDPDLADAEWVANSRPRFDGPQPTIAHPALPEVYDIAAARAKRETHEANISEMKEREKSRSLVDRTRTRKGAIDIAAELRLTIEQLPSKLGARLAAESDQAKCRQLLSDEIRGALADTVARLRTLTAKAGDERING